MGQPDKRETDPEIRTKLINDYLSLDETGCKIPITTLCKKYGINHKTFYRWVKDAGVYELRKQIQSRLDKARNKKELAAAYDYQLGEKVEAIALKHKLPRDSITFIARRAGLPKRTTSSKLTRKQVRLRMQLYDDAQMAALKANWRDPTLDNSLDDIKPVVRLVLYDSKGCWLLAMVNPDDPDIVYGLFDPGGTHPKLGFTTFSQIRQLRGPWGLVVERDLYFKPDKTLVEYARIAERTGSIIVEPVYNSYVQPPKNIWGNQ